MNNNKHCWFINNNKIVPKLNEQYILKKIYLLNLEIMQTVIILVVWL